MWIRLPYGDGVWEEETPGWLDAALVEPPAAQPVLPDLAAAVRQALDAPIGSRPLRERVRPGARVTIVVNDATRPSPTRLFLDGLVEELLVAGVSLPEITVVVATGAHRPATPEELKEILGPAHYARLRVLSHVSGDDSQQVYVGTTSRGLTLSIQQVVTQADCRILTGTIAPHHTAGYSGGRKSILPGVAAADTIRQFHSPMVQSIQPALGWFEGNPCHETALEAARLVGVDFLINAVQDPGGRGYLAVVAGDLAAAHSAGVRISESASRVKVPFQADLTLCSPGGYPRDINLHQAQKALTVGEMVTRPGGVIALVAECRSGAEGKFVEYLQQAQTPREVIDRWITGEPPMASGKAMMFARACEQHTVIVVSRAFTPEFLAGLFLRHAADLQEALASAREIVGPNPRAWIIPHASKLIPRVEA